MTLLAAAQNLLIAQRVYLADLGNEDLRCAMETAADELNAAIAQIEAQHDGISTPRGLL